MPNMPLAQLIPADVALADVPKCEIRHTVGDPCAVEAIAILKGCAGSVLICSRAVREIESHLDDRTCDVCGLSFRRCWRITRL